ncbi:MAG TPA: GNAT family N-acetyltransferase [Beijerinckiaceae bacterium]|nr:GNAT family N-acetyltransferase [Beijerinckiaceae bacterium]
MDAHARRSDYTVEFRTDLPALVEPWRGLARRALEPNPFAEPDFLLPALQHLPDGRGVLPALVWKGASLCGLVPLLPPRFALGGLRLWRPEGAPALPLLDQDDPVGVLRALAEALARRYSRPALVFPEIPDGPVAAALEEAGDDLRGRERQDPVLRGRAEGADFTRRRRVLRLERARDPRRIRDAVEEFLILEAAGAAGKAGRAFVHDPARVSFLRSATRQLARQRRCRIELLRIAGETAAAAIVVEAGRQAWLWRAVADERRGPAPLRLLLEEIGRAGPDLIRACASAPRAALEEAWPARAWCADHRLRLECAPALAPRLFGLAPRIGPGARVEPGARVGPAPERPLPPAA